MDMIVMLICPVVICVFAALCFYAGVKTSDYYHARQEAAVNFALKKQFARLQAGVDVDDPVQPYVSADMAEAFDETMRTTGQAAMRLQ